VAALARYLTTAHAARLGALLGVDAQPAAPSSPSGRPPKHVAAPPRRKRAAARAVRAAGRAGNDVAIIGVSGRFPQARTVAEFWENLKNGKDCVTEIPPERWDAEKYFDARKGIPGKSYSKWGAFIDGVDEFDPLFFNVSPRDAQFLDPQERLLLEVVWNLLEERGITREVLRSRYDHDVGVYVGSMYQLYGAIGAEIFREAAGDIGGFSAIANRVSYFYGLHGPSIAFDTMCSSGATAIHTACGDLLRGDCRLAIAGAVNLSLHPKKYIGLCQQQLIASHPRSRSFESGDGYLPAEAVAAVLLKRLRDAVDDGDEVLAVIKATAVNHNGRSNGYSVPSHEAQSQVIAACLRKAGVEPRTIGYVEAAALGSELGDAIELGALCKVFGGAAAPDSCTLGSVKSAIGHAEAASTLTQLTKVILQLRHGQMAPSIDAQRLGSDIRLAGTPFRIQERCGEWLRPGGGRNGAREDAARRALINSFGAGGSNVSMLVEEYVPRGSAAPPEPARRQIVVLSAKARDRLVVAARRLHEHLRGAQGVSLNDLAYTLQTGREAMGFRVALVVDSLDELRNGLAAYLRAADAGGELDAPCPLYARDCDRAPSSLGALTASRAGDALLEALLATNDLEQIALLWAEGGAVPWARLHEGRAVKTISLPTYPFARQRCWLSAAAAAPRRCSTS
jgi:acyl transferase domain-containing protein